MDRSLAVARQAPPSHLRLASQDLFDGEECEIVEGGDGPTNVFSPDPSYRGPGAETSIVPSSVSGPAPRVPAGGYLDVDADDVAEILEGRLDLVLDTNPKAAVRPTTVVSAMPGTPAPEDRTQVGTPRPAGGNTEPAGGNTEANARPIMRTPEGVSCGTQIVQRPIMRTPEGISSGTQIVQRPIMRTPDDVVVANVPPLGVPMTLAFERTEMRTSPIVAARLVVAGRYLVGGDDVTEQCHNVGTSFVLTRSPSSAFCDDPFVDVEHGALTFRPDGIAIDDFDSTNGVFVRVHGKVALKNGDMFRAGEELLRYTALKGSRAAGRAPALGSPDPGYWGRIDVMITLEDNAASYPIDGVEVSFGQADGHLQFPDDPYLGELHCRVCKVDKGGAVLEDFGSPCGTWLRLRSGDVVPYGAELLVGQTRLRIEQQ